MLASSNHLDKRGSSMLSYYMVASKPPIHVPKWCHRHATRAFFRVPSKYGAKGARALALAIASYYNHFKVEGKGREIVERRQWKLLADEHQGPDGNGDGSKRKSNPIYSRSNLPTSVLPSAIVISYGSAPNKRIHNPSSTSPSPHFHLTVTGIVVGESASPQVRTIECRSQNETEARWSH